MKINKFINMTDAEFEAYSPRNELESEARQKEREFRDWCKENKQDPLADESRESYNEIERECGRGAWDDMDEDEREGWTDNMNKD